MDERKNAVMAKKKKKKQKRADVATIFVATKTAALQYHTFLFTNKKKKIEPGLELLLSLGYHCYVISNDLYS